MANKKGNNYHYYREIKLALILKVIPSLLFIYATLPLRTFENKKLMFIILLLHFIVFYTIVLYLKVAKQNWFWLIVAFMTFFLDNINIKRTLILLVLCFIVICLILGIKSYVQKSRIIENIKEHKRIICIHVLLLAFLIPLIINNVNYILIAFLFLSLVIMISNSNPEKRTALLKYVNHVIWFITTILFIA